MSPTYTQSIFSLRVLQPDALLSARVAHARVLANNSAPRVPRYRLQQVLNSFNSSFLHIIFPPTSTLHCILTKCWIILSTPPFITIALGLMCSQFQKKKKKLQVYYSKDLHLSLICLKIILLSFNANKIIFCCRHLVNIIPYEIFINAWYI